MRLVLHLPKMSLTLFLACTAEAAHLVSLHCQGCWRYRANICIDVSMHDLHIQQLETGLSAYLVHRSVWLGLVLLLYLLITVHTAFRRFARGGSQLAGISMQRALNVAQVTSSINA